jgi:hypothetical protein
MINNMHKLAALMILGNFIVLEQALYQDVLIFYF